MKSGVHEHSENGEDRLRWRYQDKAYNESYKQWRKRNKDSAGFYFAENPNELTYQDGVGFIKDAPEAHEAKALKRTITVLGTVLLFRVFFDAFSTYLLPALFGAMGFDISYDIFTGKLYGGETLLITVKFVTEALSVVLPAIMLTAGFKLPFRVMLPMKVGNRHMFKACVPAAVLIGGACCVMSAVFREIFRVPQPFERAALPETVSGWIYTVITHIIIVPVISELCSGGVILQLMRQFGDGVALVLTSFITAAFCYDFSQFLFYFTAAITIRYFTLRTGSVLAGAVMRLTLSLYTFGLFLACRFTYENHGYVFVVLYLFISLILGLIFMIRFLYRHSDCFGVNMKPRYMSFGKKMMWIFTSIPVILWVTAALIITMMNGVLNG
ncbi:MAG: hypothetical protein NC253_07585 [Ruminococcus sp.]|nr:hypothetical protein [Ruminococcus sp.]MCM1382396.1 hypothetical protein [Muribaculaceae bacterium]MCM1479069.1 hypothetical protein [Muribaculaceae bacterium]